MAAYDALAQLVARLNMDTNLYKTLVACIQRASSAACRQEDALNEEQMRVAQLLKTDFERGGVHLNASGQKRVMALQEQIGQLCFQFVDSHSTDASKGVNLSVATARTLPRQVQQRLQWQAARGGEQEEHGAATLPVTREVYHLVMHHVPCAQVREAVYMAEHGFKERVVLLERILLLRKQLALELGYPSFAHMSMPGKMAASPDAARRLLENLCAGLQLKALEETRLLADLKEGLEGDARIVENVKIESWDRQFYATQARQRAPVTSSAMPVPDIREYLPLSKVIDGIGRVLHDVFAVTLAPVSLSPLESWAPDVQKFHLSSPLPAGPGELFLGTLYLDLAARPGKLNGAAHFTIQCGRLLPQGSYRAPVVALSCNFESDARAQEPLLSHHELETLLHEFGHVLHSVLGRTRYQHLSGTRAVADVVEVPSTLMEYFAFEPQVLKALSGHYLSNEPMPEDLLASLDCQRKLFAALDTLQQIVYGLVDLELHLAAPSGEEPAGWSYDVAMAAAQGRSPVSPPAGSYWYADLSHLASYGANYYSYMWSRSLSALVWRAHFAREPLRPLAGLPFVRGFLSRGGSRQGHDMLLDVLHGDPVGESAAREGRLQNGTDGGQRDKERDVMDDACDALLDDLVS